MHATPVLRTPQDAIDILNEINQADPLVLPALIGYRVPANKALGDHPTVQVGYRDQPEGPVTQKFLDHPFEVGLLGIVNGLFGVDENDWGHIYAEFNADASRIVRFSGKEERNGKERHEDSI